MKVKIKLGKNLSDKRMDQGNTLLQEFRKELEQVPSRNDGALETLTIKIKTFIHDFLGNDPALLNELDRVVSSFKPIWPPSTIQGSKVLEHSYETSWTNGAYLLSKFLEKLRKTIQIQQEQREESPPIQNLYSQQYEAFKAESEDIIEPIQGRGHYLISIHPTNSLQESIPLGRLDEIIKSISIRTSKWSFPEIDSNFTQRAFGKPAWIQFWRFHDNAHFLHYIGFYDDWTVSTLNFESLLSLISHIYTFASRLSNSLKGAEVSISIELKGTRGRILGGISLETHSTPCKDDISIQGDIIADNYQDQAWDALTKILRMFNLKDYASTNLKNMLQGQFHLIG